MVTVGQVSMKFPSLAAFADIVSAKMTRESLHKRFNTQAEAFMKKCVEFVLSYNHKTISILKSKYLSHFNNINIIDSSSWDVPKELHDVLPGSGGHASNANCKIQLCYEYLKGRLNFFEILPGTSPDNKYSANLPNHHKQNDLMLTDLGYFRLKTFKDLQDNEAFFLSRFLYNTALFDSENGQRINLHNVLKEHDSPLYQTNVIMGADRQPKVSCRIICMKVSEEIANQRRARQKKQAKKKNRKVSEIFLELAGWSILVTNVPKAWLPAEKCWSLYSLRWQIELLFKQQKSILRVHLSETQKEPRLKCELYGKMIVAIFIHIIHAEVNTQAWNKHYREVSMDKLYKRIQERSFIIMTKLRVSIRWATIYLQQEIGRILKNCLKLQQKSRPTSLERLEFDDSPPAVISLS